MNLPPGSHEVLIEASDHSPVRMLVTVRLDETVTVPVTLTESTIQEVIVVEAEQPVIDATRSAMSTELNAEMLQNMPVGRSYQSVINTLPGIYGRIDTDGGGGGRGNPSVRGEGQYGNNFYVDGISTRDPATKTFGADVQFDSIESIQVYTDGAPAEFGGATGMMVNVVTKDGGDEHHGTVGLYYSRHMWFTSEYDILDFDAGPEICGQDEAGNDINACEAPTPKRKFNTFELSGTVGGPIVKEKLWYYAALNLSSSDIVFEGAEVGSDGKPEAPYVRRDAAGFAKVTWFATPDLTFKYQFNGGGTTIQNIETSALYTPDSQQRRNDWQLGHIVSAQWRPDPVSELELKASYLPIRINVRPMQCDSDKLGPDDCKATASIFNEDVGQYLNNADSFDLNKRDRLGGELEYTRLFENLGGDHRLKTGVEFWRTYDARDLEFTGGAGDPNTEIGQHDGIQYTSSPDNDLPCDDDTDGDGIFDNCAGFQGYTNVGELGHTNNLMGFYLQDDWSPVDSITFNLGVRIDRESFQQNEGDGVFSTLMPAPRLGVSWDVTGDSKTKVSANYGRYYDIHGSSLGVWGDTKSAFQFREYAHNGTDYDLVWVQDPEQDPLVFCTNESLASYEDHLINDLGFDQEGADAELALAESYCDGEVRPYHMDKLAVAVEREIIPNLSVGIRGIWSTTQNLPEDIDTNLDTWVISTSIGKKRDYRALELTMTKKYDDRWGALASWTLSESKGHLPGQFERPSGGQTGGNGNAVGLFLDDIDDIDTRAFFYDVGLGWLPDGLAGLGTTYDDGGYYGYLPYHSFHQIKVNGWYDFSFGLQLGLVYEFDSGHAWEKKGYVPLYRNYYSFPEGRGSRFMPAVHYVDFRIGYKYEINDDQSIGLTLDIFNLPDSQTPITYYANDVDGLFGSTLFRQAPRSMRLGLKYTF